MSTPPVVLTIAGTDPGGGAGIAADLATFAVLGVHGACVVAAVTVQDTVAVHRVHPVQPSVVAAQLDAVLADLPVAVVKTGLLGSATVVRLVAKRVAGLPLVVDPVLRATTGAALADAAVIEAYRRDLLPVATVVTPNASEAEVLGPLPVPVVRTGSESGRDRLLRPGEEPVELRHDPVATGNDHGTGCTYSAALAAYLAHGHPLPVAAARAGDFTAGQLRRSASWRLGRGRGPIAHLTPDPANTDPENTDPVHTDTGGNR
jgi:hydroxymethylpyrimidine/phosphomethylpyrimidine kinase